MAISHRIAAGGIVFDNDRVLLVRYPYKKGGSYLAAPGGGLKHDENIVQAVEREVLEETGINVKPGPVVMIEDLVCSRYKMCKIWMVCEIAGGRLGKTKGAEKEGIIEAGWFKREELDSEIVFPSILLEKEWNVLKETKTDIGIPVSRGMIV